VEISLTFKGPRSKRKVKNPVLEFKNYSYLAVVHEHGDDVASGAADHPRSRRQALNLVLGLITNRICRNFANFPPVFQSTNDGEMNLEERTFGSIISGLSANGGKPLLKLF